MAWGRRYSDGNKRLFKTKYQHYKITTRVKKKKRDKNTYVSAQGEEKAERGKGSVPRRMHANKGQVNHLIWGTQSSGLISQPNEL